MSSQDPAYDVVIAGGGMVGASLALALAPTGWRIALVEPAGLAVEDSPSFDERATALSWSSRQFFQVLGLWPDILQAAGVIRHIHVSEQGRFGRVRLHAEDMGLDALGHVVPNRVIGNTLAVHLQDCANVQVHQTRSTGKLYQGVDRISLETEQGSLQGRLLVVADGARSRLRDALGLSASTLSFPHQALVANVAVERPHQDWAYERFTRSGPMAFLPLPRGEGGEHRMNLVMSLPTDQAAKYRNMEEFTLRTLLRERFGAHLGAIERIGHCGVYPLVQVQARGLLSDRAVLAGNAAMALHPVAGQGFNLALRGVGDLAERLLAVAREGGDPGALGHLEAHAVRQQKDIVWTGRWTRSLVDGFVLDWPLAGALRSKALWAMDRLSPLRRWFARQALGRLPGLSGFSRGYWPGSG
ncbi:2-octaprenyl-6-methoxyphenol hydroxylase [Natronospira proteinivora]|uniref:2-octaprenyl-6-methoxyphenol hydroxylase n=1 Tax=Natronospira proteinivora TaxID=1807133 RepID=A0ABT1G881_9GAMM|nr:FAD-dependent monooxygenase [Natronospira proteinivora]MCP1727526.1 2-octaprenyl-6-methoxyphenol hydroxylase [Natronospira proteinivora]